MHHFRHDGGERPGPRHPHHHPDPAGRPGPRGHGPRGFGRGGRAPRGDVRAALLRLLAEEPMHGYQLMRTIAERTGGRWRPSPGAVYPTLAQLEDEGLVSVTAQAGRKLVALTDAGHAHLEQDDAPDPFAGHDAAAPGADLRGLLEQLRGAVREVGRTGTDAQRAAAATVLADTRRALYLLLADGPDSAPPSQEEPTR